MGSLDGFDELQSFFDEEAEAIRKLENQHEISFSELFDTAFMKRYTKFADIETFFSSGGFSAETNEEFEAIPQSALDEYVCSNTPFSNWQDMLDTATELYITEQLNN